MNKSILAVPMLLAACGGAPSTPETPACDVSLDKLAGQSFVWIEVAPGKKMPNPIARMTFVDEGGALHAKYTAKSGTRVYDYACTKKEGTRPSLECLAKPDLKRACMALEVLSTGACTVDALAKLGLTGDAAELTPVIEETKKLVAAAHDDPEWAQFAAVANNPGNKIQGKLTIAPADGACAIKVDDRYVAVYNGQRSVEDNPVGHATFIPTQEPFLFEDCRPETTLVDLDADALPADPATIPADREHGTGAPVHYHVLAHTPEESAAKEGCTYAVDTFANGRPVDKQVPVEVKDGKVLWHAAHTWQPSDLVLLGKVDGADVQGAIFHMKRTQVCNGAGSTIDIACNMTRLVPSTVAAGEPADADQAAK